MPEYSLSWILPFARAALAISSDFNFPRFVDAMWTEMEKAGVKVEKANPLAHSPGSQFQFSNLPLDLTRSAVEAWMYMRQHGYLVPRDANFPSTTLDRINFDRTPRGEKWSRGIEPLPEDPTGYMNSVSRLVSSLDSVIEQYLAEGVSSFEDEHYFAAAVMVGAASEKCLYRVADAMFAAVKTPKLKTDLEKAYKYRKFSDLFEVIKSIVSNAAKLPDADYEVFNGAGEQLVSIFKAIQTQRNDAVHPMNAVVSDDEVRLTFLAFPFALEKVEKLRTWFQAHPSSV
jgi:hypothetical protein